jgi:hypothetical protein
MRALKADAFHAERAALIFAFLRAPMNEYTVIITAIAFGP